MYTLEGTVWHQQSRMRVRYWSRGQRGRALLSLVCWSGVVLGVAYWLRQKSVIGHWCKHALWTLRYRHPPFQPLTTHYSISLLQRYRALNRSLGRLNASSDAWLRNTTRLENTMDALQLEYLDPPEVLMGPYFALRLHYACRRQVTRTRVPLLLCFSALTPLDTNVFTSHYGSRVARVLTNPKDSNATTGVTGSRSWTLNPQRYRRLFAAFTLFGASFPHTSHLFTRRLEDLDKYHRAQRYAFQNVIHELFRYINITAFSSAGTLLGSLRHFDNVPWDDDDDFMVPLQDVATILAFLSGGNMSMFQLRHEVMHRAAVQWWTRYTQETGEEQRRALLTYFQSKLKVIVNEPFSQTAFALKIYCATSHHVHPYPWTFPNVDVFVFQFVDDNRRILGQPHNASAQLLPEDYAKLTEIAQAFSLLHHNRVASTLLRHVYVDTTPLQDPQPVLDVFPLVYRPLNRHFISAPRLLHNTPASDLPTGFYTMCDNGGWSHIYEIGRYSQQMPCFLLQQHLPFVTSRETWFVEPHTVTTFHAAAQSVVAEDVVFKNVLLEQLHFWDPKRWTRDVKTSFTSKANPLHSQALLPPPTCSFRVLCSSLKPSSHVTSEDMDRLLNTPKARVPTSVSVTYEQMSVKDYLVSDLVLLGSPHVTVVDAA